MVRARRLNGWCCGSVRSDTGAAFSNQWSQVTQFGVQLDRDKCYKYHGRVHLDKIYQKN